MVEVVPVVEVVPDGLLQDPFGFGRIRVLTEMDNELERLLEVVERAFGLAQTRCLEKDRKNNIDGLFQKLTPREREICLFLSKGYTAKEIGRSLNISPRTAEIHRSRIMEKLTVDSNADLVSLAIAQGIRD